MTKRALAAIAAAALSATSAAHADIIVNGTYDTDYGSALAVQTNNTGFGDGNGSGGGSELDAAFGKVQNGNLYLLLTGNLETNYNHLNVYIQAGSTGQSTLNVSGALSAANGTKFSPTFAPTYALDINGDGGTTYINTNNLNSSPGSSSYAGSFQPNNSSATTLQNVPLVASFNNTNTAGVNGSQGTAADTSAAVAVTTGMEIAIPLSTQFGGYAGPFKVMAIVNGGGNGYLSNQFLPSLPINSSNPGGTTFDFSNTSSQFFTVAAATGGTGINGVYNFSAGGTYNAPSHWIGGVPLHAGDRAYFNSSIGAPSTITLDAAIKVGQITFNSPISYTIAAGTGGTLTIDDTGDIAGVTPQITTNAGAHTISAPVALANGVTFATASGTTLTVSGVLSGTGPIAHIETGTLILSGANTFNSSSITSLNGTLELDNATAAGTAQVFIGDPTADGAPASLNIGVAGLTIANSLVTNQDDSGLNNQRTISLTHPTGTTTFTGGLSLDGAVVFTAPAGATLVYAGVISNGQNGASTAKHDVSIGNISGANGTVVLSAANTYTGDTYVNTGTLNLPAGSAISSTNVYVNGGATLLLTGTLPSTSNLTAGGSITITPTSTPRTFASISFSTNGAIVVTPAANYSGHTLITTAALSLSGGPDAWTSKLDLGNSDLVLNNGDIATTTNQVKNGLATGNGIASSVAAASTTHLTTLGTIVNSSATNSTVLNTVDGQSVSTTDVIVKYTFFGDANLDGKVDGSDYSLIDAGLVGNRTAPGSQTGWYHGDFNYDGSIDGSDYTLIDNAYNRQRTQLSSAALIASPTALTAGTSAVPEPTPLGLAAIASLLAMRRRR